nr:Uncharacterised protein [Klebsiella pneumoniae]
MAVSGYCRSTYYTAPTLAERKRAIDENRRALDDAATLNAACYMQVVGGLPQGSKDLYDAREQVKHGIRQLLPHSREVGVPIARAVASHDHRRSLLSLYAAPGAGLVR